MSEVASRPAWQTSGATMTEEHKYEQHIRPENKGYIDNKHKKRSRPLSTALNQKLSEMGIKKRSKLYLFGKQYLQRDPSFIVAPDLSKKYYTLKTQDVTVPKPELRELDEEEIIEDKRKNDKRLSQDPTDPSKVPLMSSFETSADGSSDETRANAHNGAGHGTARSGSGTAAGSGSGTADSGQWGGKLSLPVKTQPWQSPRLSLNHSVGSKIFSPPLPSQGPPPLPTSSRGQSAQILYTPSSRPPTADFNTNQTPRTPISSKIPKHPIDDNVVLTPTTPTALPSNYRPESWRRSVLLGREDSHPNSTRSAKYNDDDDDDNNVRIAEVDEALEFVGTFGTFLKRAIAERAERTLNRKSWAQRHSLELGLEFSNSSQDSIISDSDTESFTSSRWSATVSENSITDSISEVGSQLGSQLQSEVASAQHSDDEFEFTDQPNISNLSIDDKRSTHSLAKVPSNVSSIYSAEHNLHLNNRNQSDFSLESPRELLNKRKSRLVNPRYSESNEILTHVRQTTMASLWGPEDESEQGSIISN